MAYCNSHTLSGLNTSCDPSMGGIDTVYIAHKDEVTNVTVTTDKITEITKLDSAKFKEYRFRKGTGTMTSTYTTDPANGVYFCQTDVALAFNRQDTQKRVEIQALLLDDIVMIVKDCNGTYWYLGYDEPVNASAGGAETGTARSDRNAYTITLTDYSKELPYEVDSSIISGLIA